MQDKMAADAARDDMLVLVDGLDRQVGTATKERAHRDGLLHRAFSVVLVRDGVHGPEMLLTQRASGKYHSAGLWTNSCCSHPRAGEELVAAAHRRTHEELGCDAINLREVCAFVYRATFEDGLCEYEYDHVFVGSCAGEPDPDPAETQAVRWVAFDELASELEKSPDSFTAWAFMVLTAAMRDVLATR